MATALRELAVFLGVEVDEAAIDDAEKGFSEFASNIAGYAMGIGVALAGIAVGVTEMGREMAVAIDSGSRQLGISRQEFQQWAAVAEAAGAEGDKIIDTMANIQEKARGVALDPRGEMARTFERLGIAARDANGQIRSGPQLMRDAANALARMGPGTEQTATAMELFGDAGRELLPVLGQGSAAIDRAIADFERLGGGLDDEAIASSLEFNRTMLQLKATITGALSPVLRALNPIFTTLAEWTTRATAAFRAFAERTTILRTTMIALALGGVTALTYALYASLPAVVAWVIAWAPFIAGTLLAAGAIAILTLALDDLIVFLEGGNSALGELLDTLFGAGTAREVLDRIKVGADNFAHAIDAAKVAVNLLTERFNRGLEAGSRFADKINEKLAPLQPLFDGIGRALDRIMGPLERAFRLAEGIRNLPASIALAALDQATTRPGGGTAPPSGPIATAGVQGVPVTPGVVGSALMQPGAPVMYGKTGATTTTTVNRQTEATLTVNANGIVDQATFARQLAREIGPVLAQVTRDAADDTVQGPGL